MVIGGLILATMAVQGAGLQIALLLSRQRRDDDDKDSASAKRVHSGVAAWHGNLSPAHESVTADETIETSHKVELKNFRPINTVV
jgi:hypothetical protein